MGISNGLLIAMGMTSAVAATLELPRVDVFPSGEHGYFVYRIPGLAVTPKGALLAYAEARRTSASDWDDIHLVIR